MVQVLDVIRRRLLPVPVALPPYAMERQQRLTELLQISQFLVGCSYEHCFGAFVYSYQLVQGSNGKRAQSGLHGPLSTSSCDLLPYHRDGLVSGPTQTCSSSSGMADLPGHLLQVLCLAQASTSRESNQHRLRIELSKLAQD